jgi:hypothetical protein
MPLVSISEAARLIEKDRSYFHKSYISTGKISVDRSDPKKPKIDTAELMRVFGGLTHIPQDKPQGSTSEHTHVLQAEIERLKTENEGLRALSEERKSRIEEQLERMKTIEARYDRLIEDKQSKPALRSLWDRVKACFSD